MILSTIAALSVLHTLENLNKWTPVQAGPAEEEARAVKKLQGIVGKDMWSDHARGTSTMLRWLRGKKMNVQEAEKMIRAHLKWRKELEMDKLRNLPADTKLLYKFQYNMTGFARNEDPVMTIPFGKWDIQSYIATGGTRKEFDKHQGQMWEKALAAVEFVEMKKQQKKDNSPVGCIVICDMSGLQYRQLARFTSAQFVLSVAINVENNYPEVIKEAHLINSDWVVETLLRIIRPFMTGSMEKLKVYSTERPEWEKVVRRLIDPAILTYRYGGYSPKEREKRGLQPLPP